MSFDDVLLETQDGVATVTFNRPNRLNAMSSAGFGRLRDVLEEIRNDDAVRALVLTGVGRGFCAGGDLNDMAAGDERSLEESTHELRSLMGAAEILRDMPKISIAAVNGPCAGAGLAIACAADIRFAGESAVFASAFLGAGLSGDFGGSWTLPRLLGEASARALYLLGERVSAVEALRLGLVTAVVSDVELRSFVNERARRAADSAPVAVAAMKANLGATWDHSFSTALDIEAVRHSECGRTWDAGEAARAFTEKRPALFRGR